jgi:release factor glutamine methyltransferase
MPSSPIINPASPAPPAPRPEAAVTVAEALREAERALAAAGIGAATFDAELLLRHVCGWERPQVFVARDETLDDARLARFRSLVAERAKRRPLQYVTGRQAFWRHDFEITEAVLIPRPETEILVEAALECLKPLAAPLVVDIGTGSGCIALSIAAERPDARVLATDISHEALAVAKDNGVRIGATVEWREGDLLAPVADVRGSVDLLASNPPYVDPTERNGLEPEVRDHEPAVALFPPEERYSVYRRLAHEAHAYIRPGGFLLLEIGFSMEDEVARLCTEGGFTVERIVPDLQSIPRTIVARR